MRVILILIIIFLVWKWFYYRAFSIGLMYFARIEHNWEIDNNEIKKIVEYSVKRIINDFLKGN